MKFCPKCETRLKLKQVKSDDGTLVTLVCDNCGYTDKAGKSITKPTEEELVEAPAIKVVGEKESKLSTLPTIKVDCPKCGHGEANWWFLQTRSGDEPPTQFYRCLNCNHTWRSYS
jgi:DNA-directed RNA polymerase subunit M